MFQKLLPKEEKYFDNFKEMISHISQMASYTHQLFNSDPVDKNLIIKLKPLENLCDDISSKVVKRLNKTYITPFDREDIFALIKRLDDISDMLLGAAMRVETFNIKKKIDYADKLAAIVLEQIKELGKAIQDLKIKSTNEMKTVKKLQLKNYSSLRKIQST